MRETVTESIRQILQGFWSEGVLVFDDEVMRRFRGAGFDGSGEWVEGGFDGVGLEVEVEVVRGCDMGVYDCAGEAVAFEGEFGVGWVCWVETGCVAFHDDDGGDFELGFLGVGVGD